MSTQIKDTFEQKLPVNITPAIAQALIKFTISFEVQNGAALATPYLGLIPVKFKDSYKQEFFDIFNTNGKLVTKLFSSFRANTFAGLTRNDLRSINRGIELSEQERLKEEGLSASSIKKIINTIGAINKDFKVVSDPFNLFTNYVTHKLLTSNLPEKLKYDAAAAVLKILQYKYFTSLVNFRFKYKPSADAMRTTYEQLSDRFDIRKYGTWKNVMDKRVEDLLSEDSIHRKTLLTFIEDKDVLYLITDFQTRIRNQINIFVEEYMRVKETGDLVGDYSATGSDSESGEKVILDQEDKFTNVALAIYSDSLNVSRWLFDPAIKITVSLFSAISIAQFRSFLISYSEYAVVMNNQNKKEEVIEKDGVTLHIGPANFVRTVIQQSMRYCINSGIDVTNTVAVLKTIRGVMSSSRISDPGIIGVRMSSAYITGQLYDSNREATLSALRIGLIIYIILITIKMMK